MDKKQVKIKKKILDENIVPFQFSNYQTYFNNHFETSNSFLFWNIFIILIHFNIIIFYIDYKQK